MRPPAPAPAGAGRLPQARRRIGAGNTAQKAKSLFKDPFRLGIAFLLIDTISKTSGQFPVLSQFRIGLLLFGGCSFLAVLNAKNCINLGVFKYPVPKLIIGQAVLACGSALFGISLGHSAVFILTTYWKTLAVAFLLILSLRGLKDVRNMVWATAIGGVVLGYTASFIVHISKTQNGAVYDANDIGTIIVITLPLVILAIHMSKGIWRYLSVGGLFVVAMTIAVSQSRGAFVGLVAVGSAILIVLPGVSIVKRLMYIGGIAAVFAMYAPAEYWQSIVDTYKNPTADYNWDARGGRRQLAKRGIGYMMDHPIFGLGVDNFGMEEGLGEYGAALEAQGIGVKWSAPHNSWIEAGAETGIPGLVLWAALILGSAVRLMRLRHKMPKSWARDGTPDQRFLYLATLYVPISLLGFAVTATFVSFAWSDQSYVLPAIAMGLQMACEKEFGLGASTPARPVRAGRALRPSAA